MSVFDPYCRRPLRQPYQRTLLLGVVALSLLSGCAVVRVSPQATSVSLIEQRESILTRNRLSEASISVLAMTGQDQSSCLKAIDDCLNRLKLTPQMSSEQYLSTASELYLANAKLNYQNRNTCRSLLPAPPLPKIDKPVLALLKDNTPEPVDPTDGLCRAKEQAALLNSIRHAYAYLLFSNRQPSTRLFDNRQVQVRDFYNLAVSRFVSDSFSHQTQPMGADLSVHVNDIRINIQIKSPSLQRFALPEELVAADDLGFSGLRAINRRDGFGVEFVAVLPRPTQQQPTNANDADDDLNAQTNNIHRSRFLPLSLVMSVQGDTLNEVLTSNTFVMDVYNPYDNDHITFGNQHTTPLAANFSAPYGLWLARTDLASTAYRSLLGIEEREHQPQLYMLEPYNPNKRVVVLIHGLASSPEAWISLTNDVLGDPILRNHYQVWQVFYPTNMPMLESRYEIDQLIRTTYRLNDPKAKNLASKNSVLIGHSMGSVIGRLLVSNSDLSTRALKGLNTNDRRSLLSVPMIRDRFQMHALPNITRAVFVSAPFRGTDFADRWFTRAIRRVIQLPATFIKTIDKTIARAQLDAGLMNRVGESGLLDFQNGPSELSRHSTFMDMTADVSIRQGLVYHSIMGRLDPNTPVEQSSDGIVPYSSSHLEGAVSEKIITGRHSIQETPEAVLELRRILRLHLETIGDVKPQQSVLPPATPTPQPTESAVPALQQLLLKKTL